MEQQDKLTLGVNPAKQLLYLGGCLLFVIIGLWMVFDNNLIGWLAILFFGLGVVVFSINLFSQNASYLRLTPEGFTVRSLFRSHTYRWSEVENFEAGKIEIKHVVAGLALDVAGHFVNGVGNPPGVKTVVFNFTPSYQPQHKLRKINEKLLGSEAGLPDTYGMNAEDLAELLNEWKRRFTPPDDTEQGIRADRT